MEIGWFLTCYGPLGGVRSVIETGNALIRMKHKFMVLGNVGPHKSAFCEDLNSVGNHVWFPLNNPASAKKSLGKLNEFDLLFNQDPATMSYSEYAKSKNHVVHYCGADGACYEKYVGKIEGARTACSKHLHETSKRQDKDGLYKHYYIGQGVNLREFSPMPFKESIYKGRRDNKKINILCCGKRGGAHKGNKGTHDIIEASKLLDKNKYNFIYFDLTKQGFPDYFKIIETLSNQNTLRDVYALADIYIAPDYVSAWNCCAGEAMACKKPVIASTKGIDDFGKDGDTCLIYEENRPDSPEVLAGKIEMLADDIDLRNKIAKNGYENIKNFTWDKVAERIVDMAKDLGIKV